MELSLSGGEVAAKSKRTSSDGAEEEDHISALPDDILLRFLLRLETAAAGRTSVLSKRWHRVWKLLPELCFRRDTTDLHRVRAAKLCMVLRYPRDIGGSQYLMEEIAVLPRFTTLDLVIDSNGHTFGASVFHLLKMCIGLKELKLSMWHAMEARIKSTWPPLYIRDEPSNWKTEELTLNCLQTVEIYGIKGVDHEVTFLKRLLNWATILETMSITFHRFVSKDRAKKFRQTLSSFSRAETCMEFYMNHDVHILARYLLAPNDDHDV